MTAPLPLGPPKKKATIRLRRLSVHAVALVPQGANLITWAEIRKGLDMDGTAQLTLPKAAQEAIVAGLGKGIESLMALLDMAKTATPSDDPDAVVPPEFCEAIEGVGLGMLGMAEQYAPATENGPGETAGEQPMQMSATSPEDTAQEMALALQLAKGMRKMLRKSALLTVAKSYIGALTVTAKGLTRDCLLKK